MGPKVLSLRDGSWTFALAGGRVGSVQKETSKQLTSLKTVGQLVFLHVLGDGRLQFEGPPRWSI